MRILANSSFRNLWLASLCSMMGSQIGRVSLILYVFETGGSVINLALLAVFDTLPGALAAPAAGAAIDGFNKRVVMVASDLVRMLCVLIILFEPSLDMIYLMAALQSVAAAFFQPARAAAIPLIVGRDELSRANAVEQSAANLTMVVGPVVGAALLSRFGLTVSLLFDAMTFLASAMLVWRVSVREVLDRGRERSGEDEVGGIREGWNYIVRHPLALHLNMLLFVALICTSMWVPLAPFFISNQLGGSGHVLGWQLGLYGLGAVAGGLFAPRLIARFGLGVTLFAGFLAEATSLFAYGIVSNLTASMIIIFVWGVAVSVVVVPFYTILQFVVEEQFLGRVFSVVKQSENVAVVIAMMVAILLQDRFGSHVIFISAGLIYFGCTAISSLSSGGRALLATR